MHAVANFSSRSALFQMEYSLQVTRIMSQKLTGDVEGACSGGTRLVATHGTWVKKKE